MNNNVNVMKYDLTQADIDRLDDYEYAMFLAYGDTFRNQISGTTGEGTDQLWPDEAARILTEAGESVVRLSKRVRNSIYNHSTPWGYQRNRFH